MMKINNVNIPKINPYRNNDIQTQKTKATHVQQADKLEISSEAKQLSGVSSYEVERNEKISAIKVQIESGTYKVNADQLAQKMLKHFNE